MFAVYCGCSVLVLVSFLLLPRVTVSSVLTRQALTDTILHFEELNFDTSHLLNQHKRLRRSADPHDSIRWTFSAHGRDFNLLLKPDSKLFTDDFIAETDKRRITFDKRKAYIGYIQGELKSSVSGVLLNDGRFEGTIKAFYDEFIVERAEKFLPESQVHDGGFHSVIYRVSDVDSSALRNVTTCRTKELASRLAHISKHIKHNEKISNHDQNMHDVVEKYSSAHHTRMKRAVDLTKTVCELYIQADHSYYNKHGKNEETVIEQLVAHVSAANSIYGGIDFNADSSADNVQFVVKRLKIWTDSTDVNYPFPGNYGVEKFLEKFSASTNLDPYCLGFVFTYRDFNDGTLGLAWTGDVDASGGVCARNGIYRNQAMSLNSGIVTTLNFQRDVSFAVSKITFAHEIGHNLGSGHDSESDSTCAPGGTAGNFIMYPKATDGDKVNNDKFSPCSIASINAVINLRARHDGTDACFKVFSGSVCGNKITEPGEECDCGWEDECTESCCNPMKDLYDASVYSPCNRTASAICSPSEGICCKPDCTLRTLADNVECREATACQNPSICDGTAAECPTSTHKSNSTSCAEGMVCYIGDCSHSVCEAHGLALCQCSPANAEDWSDPQLCKLCCVDSSDGLCKSTSEISSTSSLPSDAIIGMPCFDYQGYCDVFSKCRKLNPVGAINSLKKILFSEEGLTTMKDWLIQNWYIAVAAFLGLVIILILVVRFGAKRHPEDNEPRNTSKNKVTPMPKPVNPRNR